MSLSIERPSLVDAQDPTLVRPAAEGGKPLFDEQGPSFADLLDIVNPLQHLPIVGTIYRALTGDALSDGARLAGGALYGGPLGLLAAMGAIGFERATGHSLEETALALATGREAPAASAQPTVALAAAAAQPAAPPPAPAQSSALAPAAPPQLSPEAFDALLRSVQPAPARAISRPAAWSRPSPTQAPVEMTPAMRGAAGGLPQASLAAREAVSRSAPPAPVAPPPNARQASLELHETLRAYAQQQGQAVR